MYKRTLYTHTHSHIHRWEIRADWMKAKINVLYVPHPSYVNVYFVKSIVCTKRHEMKYKRKCGRSRKSGTTAFDTPVITSVKLIYKYREKTGREREQQSERRWRKCGVGLDAKNNQWMCIAYSSSEMYLLLTQWSLCVCVLFGTHNWTAFPARKCLSYSEFPFSHSVWNPR